MNFMKLQALFAGFFDTFSALTKCPAKWPSSYEGLPAVLEKCHDGRILENLHLSGHGAWRCGGMAKAPYVPAFKKSKGKLGTPNQVTKVSIQPSLVFSPHRACNIFILKNKNRGSQVQECQSNDVSPTNLCCSRCIFRHAQGQQGFRANDAL